MKPDDIDIDLNFKVRLNPRVPFKTAAEALALAQEETRLNYYMDKLADIVRDRIQKGEPILITEIKT